jgi:O-methyltransferase involved in polyketide biosynthesis
MASISAGRDGTVGMDLRRDWPTALGLRGFDPARSTAWIAEGPVLGYLPPGDHDEILDAITTLSASGRQMRADYFDVRRPEALSEILEELHDNWPSAIPN